MVTTVTPERADEDTLRRCVERIVRDRPIGSGQLAIAGIYRQRFERASSYPCDIVTVDLASGDELTIFLKNFCGSQLLQAGLPQRRERELRVYRDLLTEADLSTATYYGSVWDESHGQYWLLLEFVHGMNLRRGDVDSWVLAAGWLGRMQRYFAQWGPRLEACDSLLRHDAHFFWSTAHRALQAVSRISPPSAERLAHILHHYDQLVDVMARQPLTLVHGSYTPPHIVVDLGSTPPRVCPTGWGLAALGAPLYDLAFLSDGCDPATLDRLWDAYGAEAAGCGLSLPDREDMRYVVECFRLHKIIQSLSESLERGFRERTAAGLVDRGERLSKLVLGHPERRKTKGGRPKTGALPPSAFRLADHPATRAWREIQPEHAAPPLPARGAAADRQCPQGTWGEPNGIDTLQEGKKAAIYRLKGVGPGGAAVIAKRCGAATAALERTIYEDILPHLPVTALRFYGCTRQEGEFCWLFLEDAGRERYSPYSKEHCALAGRWLGLLHMSAARLAPTAWLPDRGPGHYLEHLRSARHTILRNLDNPALSSDDLAVLQAILAQCDFLEARWSHVEMCCAGIPSTLVHGDFRPRNVHVRRDHNGSALLPMDWETAGWGVPAPDLARVDVRAYWTVVRECWPTLDLPAIERLANLGTLFCWLAAMRWDSMSLKSDWLDGPMASIRVCHARLSDAILAIQWTE